MFKISGTVRTHGASCVPDIFHDGVSEKNIILHPVDVKLVHTVKYAVNMLFEDIAPGKKIAVVVRLFLDPLSLDVVAFEKEKYTDEGNTW